MYWNTAFKQVLFQSMKLKKNIFYLIPSLPPLSKCQTYPDILMQDKHMNLALINSELSLAFFV